MKTFEEQEAKGVKFSEDHKTLLRVPTDFSGEYENSGWRDKNWRICVFLV